MGFCVLVIRSLPVTALAPDGTCHFKSCRAVTGHAVSHAWGMQHKVSLHYLQCKESVWGRRLQCVTVTEPPPKQFWKLVHTCRGFKTIPAFSVSFFRHGANLGFQFCLTTKCSVQKWPGAFSSGVASTSIKWRGGVRKFHLRSIQKMLKKSTWLTVKWIDVPQKLFAKHKIKCSCLPESLFLAPCIEQRKFPHRQGFAAGSPVL